MTKLNLPKSIKICGYTFKLETCSDTLKSNEDGVEKESAGLYDYSTMLMKVVVGKLCVQQIRNTILHESLHAIFNTFGYVEENDDEHLIATLTAALESWITENPKIMALYGYEKANKKAAE